MSVFKGLLPPKHKEIVQTLIFQLAEWQALAKLRLHMDDTLALLDQALQRLGAQVRRFWRVTCAAFETKELSQESAQRQRRELAKMQSGYRKRTVRSSHLPKSDNINIVQVSCAWRLQPDDKDILHHRFILHSSCKLILIAAPLSLSIQANTPKGERAHRLMKKFYRGSNKKAVETQFGRQER